MNRALFRAMFKQHRKKIAVISTGIVLYEGLLTWVYPVIAENPAVTEIAVSLPTAVKTVFGVPENARTDTFEAFISGQFFARIWVMLMAVYGIQTANNLLAKMVDDCSIALLLSTPISRSEILSTQAAVLIFLGGILVTVTILGLFFGASRSGITICHDRYVRLGLLGFSFFSLIEIYSLFFSVWFVEEERALTYAAGLTLIFYCLDIVGGLSNKYSWLKKVSLFQLFQPQEVLEGSKNPAGSIVGLNLVSMILWQWAKRVFESQDLAI
ncbi:ABC transporter permease [Desulfosporosinus sp. HMP52]|uniref:ABC transporter permease subunit n=1 Tax=Desulfosporosinus sp. HMP52 TaxID=1487923 RepID=UPI00051FC0CD|nr:ABC transporter permease subunit [Desulfosporosinus sp. HMP52]KGK86211.1 ABC transporter permease [Desulfosporosinus sp. HMP52]